MAVLTQPQLLAEVVANVRTGGVGGLTTAADVRDLITDVIDTLFYGDNQLSVELTSLEGEVVYVTGDQLIAGLKSFTTLPQSTANPSDNKDLTTKVYVDAAIAAAIAAIAGGGSYNSNRVIKRQVVGLEGVNLNKATLNDTLDELLYPVKIPDASMSIPSPYHEYGETTAIPVSWTATKLDQNIDLITVGGVSQTPTGNTQSGTQNVPTSGSADTTINMTVGSSGKTKTISILSKIVKCIRYGGSTHDGVVVTVTDADINTLQRFFAPNDVTDFKTRVTVAAGNYLLLCIPASLGVPLIYLDEGRWTQFRQLRSGGAYVNPFGYSDTVNLYISQVPLAGTYYIQFK